MSPAPLGVYYSVGCFFPCDSDVSGESETTKAILKALRRIPDASSIENKFARLHWRFTNPIEAQGFWRRATKEFPALPWNILHNPAWVEEMYVPDHLPVDF